MCLYFIKSKRGGKYKKENGIMVILGSQKIKDGNKMWRQFSYRQGSTILITHEFTWIFRNTMCPSFFGKLSLNDTNDGASIDIMVGLSRGDQCNGFNVVEWYTI